MYKDNPDYEYLDWLVSCRSENQRTSIAIYRLLIAHEESLYQGTPIGDITRNLTEIVFSLWRSVFLSDNNDGMSIDIDTKQFLHNLIANNTVGYAQDKAARGWTFNYYVDNARFRLRHILENQPFMIVDAKYKFDRSFGNSQNWWEYHQRETSAAVDRISAHLLANGLPGSDSN